MKSIKFFVFSCLKKYEKICKNTESNTKIKSSRADKHLSATFLKTLFYFKVYFKPVLAIPLTKYFCVNRNITTTGKILNVAAAINIL